MDTCIGRVSLNRALELLKARGDEVKQSTLSRYVAKYVEARAARGGRPVNRQCGISRLSLRRHDRHRLATGGRQGATCDLLAELPECRSERNGR